MTAVASRDRAFGRVDTVRVWRGLADARVNYAVEEVRRPAWNIDTYSSSLPAEGPGPPAPGGTWERACRLVRDYEFSPPRIVRAVYDPEAPLLGRDMLLEARFHGLRFYCGVRVTEVVDRIRGDVRVWGWAYETLEGHLERGRVTYEVVKHCDTGEVRFVVSCYSQGAPTLGRVTRFGWQLFGRRTQLRFYRECIARLRRFVESAPHERPARLTRTERLVCVPSDARSHCLDALAIRRVAPG
ncbi:DUF1990 domain-containing protein [Streptomyces sp. NBC_00820]|uniref:DUF1990 family protein n=1 Tax=Streptomyces sp. NBC_00820 TaxID=2975842 RepID=UPI002ECFF8D2|nr:DUF1990 domain-containing protein [Streptomyces sp. NBC_00820]